MEREPGMVQSDVRELGDYLVRLSLDDQPELPMAQARAWRDDALPAWLNTQCRVTLHQGQWREQCGWCGGTATAGGHARGTGADGAGNWGLPGVMRCGFGVG